MAQDPANATATVEGRSRSPVLSIPSSSIAAAFANDASQRMSGYSTASSVVTSSGRPYTAPGGLIASRTTSNASSMFSVRTQATNNANITNTTKANNTTTAANTKANAKAGSAATTATTTTGPVAPIITVSSANPPGSSSANHHSAFYGTGGSSVNHHGDIEEEDEDYEEVVAPPESAVVRSDKASRLLGIRHQRSMEPVPANSPRASIKSTRSVPDYSSAAPPPPIPPANTFPLTSLYVVSGLPKSPQTWTLADTDSVIGLHHSENAVSRWWRPEVLGSTVSPGAGGNAGGKKRKKSTRSDELIKATSGPGALSKSEVGKMLSKALKLSFTREIEIVTSTLQPASTVHTFTFDLPAPSTPLAPNASTNDLLRASVLTTGTHSLAGYPYDPQPPRPSSSYLGPPVLAPAPQASSSQGADSNNTVTYHGVCLTVWSHADAERSAAIRRTLESSNSRNRKESAQSRMRGLRPGSSDPSLRARRTMKKHAKGPWGPSAGALTDAETDYDAETDAEGAGAASESEWEGHGPGESTLFLPGDAVFWLPYALTLVSRHPVYDLMRDYLTLSWARFSKDVQSHTLQISKILSHPAPRAGELVRLDASPSKPSAANDEDANLEVIARFPGGLDFGRGLVDVNFTMWPLFKCLNVDNILTICEIALAPTGRVLFFSRHPAILGIAVMTIKYLVELRGWSGVALPAIHSRDIKIYLDDPGPWILGLATEARMGIRPPPEVCVCDLDINYLSCPSPPPGVVSTRQQRDKYRKQLLTAFDAHYHPDHSVPTEFKEAFPAGRFRPICKIQAKRAGSTSAVADPILAPSWWHSTRVIQAFDAVLQDKFKRPSLLKRISTFGAAKRAPRLTVAEQSVQNAIRKRATAFVDARDDLETKIGRLTRRLNFLMTESDLWRDKFVTFEQYAEKLSAEAGQLRSRVNKEQKETKRLTGLYSNTAAEKVRLENLLQDAENAHLQAKTELEEMRQNMERMEAERADMIAEVEAQIERALASMAVDIDIDVDSDDYPESRPQSRMSSSTTLSTGTRSRRASDAKNRPFRSFSIDSTLAGHDNDIGDDIVAGLDKKERVTDTINEEEEEPPMSATRKRFSITELDPEMNAVDEGISQSSDRIAQKVLDIQKKLETALATDRRSHKTKQSPATDHEDSEAEHSEKYSVARRHRKKSSRGGSRKHLKARSGASSPVPASSDSSPNLPHSVPSAFDSNSVTPRQSVDTEVETSAPERNRRISTVTSPINVRSSLTKIDTSSAVTTPVTPALSHGVSGATDESDNDFQSAYSRSSYADSRQVSPKDDFAMVDSPTITDRNDEVQAFRMQPPPKRLTLLPSARYVNDVPPSPVLSEATDIPGTPTRANTATA